MQAKRGGLAGFFDFEGNGTKLRTEVLAGLTTFFTMAYIVVVNPSILSVSGMPWGAVFLATIIAAVIGTLVMGLFANVPYAQAPGMGLNAFFVFTVHMGLGFSWQHALSMVFLCGLLNIIFTVTKLRKSIIKAIPNSLQNAIGGGIGVFIAYIGFINAGFLKIGGEVPTIPPINSPALWLFLGGLIVTVVLMLLKVRGAILIGIILTALAGIPLGLTAQGKTMSFAEAFSQLPQTLGVIFTKEGLGSLFSDVAKLPLILITIFAFSLTDTFDTIGTFIGTGRKSGIFTQEDQDAMESGHGYKSKMDKALFADATATSIGAIFGTSNTTTYVESAAGIAAGGRTGFTSVVVALCFALSAFLASFVSAVPAAATAPALIVVGVMMLSSFKEIKWDELEEAFPAFFAGIFMALSYSISHGIGTGFIVYCLVKLVTGKAKEVHPILWGAAALFVLNFVLLAML